MKPHFISSMALTLAVSLSGAATLAQPDSLTDAEITEEILVTADFRQAQALNLATSVSVIDADTIENRNAEHLAEVLNLAPNVNMSTGASRGRFFQIRGIGERSQFVEPINPSVGLIVDGIDLTGIGGAATTLDIQQIEILRGPQGTLYGANALAGLINMVSGQPTETLTGEVKGTVAQYDTRTFSGVLSGPVNDQLGFRVAVEQHKSDGYQENAFLGIDDNQNFDEQTARAKMSWQPSDDLQLDVTALYVDVDNGYDAFSLDNTRTTLSDQPGHDRQETLAGSINMRLQATDAYELVTLFSHANSDLEYGYDEDWAYEDLCVDFDCIYDGYNSFDNYLRDNRNTTADVRLVSSNSADELGWLAGAYFRDQSENLRREYTYLSEDFLSDFSTKNRALYGQLDIPLAQQWKLVTGLRYEEREADYADSDGATFEPQEDMWGGKLALEYRTEADTLIYALASRGYKAGGFNSNQDIPAVDREFFTETMWNYEAGIKGMAFENRLQAQLAVFYQDRSDVQTKQSLVRPIEGELCPCRFIDYTTNAAAGNSYGLEAELNWQAGARTQLFASLGLLQSEFENFASFAHAQADRETGEPFDLSGHELPHAPNYQFAVGALVNITERWYARVEVEGKDAFFFSSRHEAKSDAYELLNVRLGYTAEDWELALWGRNLADQDYQTRGFGSFGNDPRKGYATEPYHQYGDPRVIGVSVSYSF